MTREALIAAAAAWNDAGVATISVANDGTKAPRPIKWGQYRESGTTTEQTTAMIEAHDSDGIGVITGTPSGGLEMFELEREAVEADLVARLGQIMADHDAAELWERVKGGYSEMSGGGGIHYFYRVAGNPRGNVKLARRPASEAERAANPEARIVTLIETRGEGGFAIVAPSGGRTHSTGGAWIVLAGSPAGIPTITADERDLLHALATMLDEMPTRDDEPLSSGDPLTGTAAALGAGEYVGGVKPGDDFNARASWDDILTPHGWQCARRLGKGFAWTRPGKPIRDGISATTGQSESGDRLYVFSSSTEFETERPYSKFGAYAVLNHDGDYPAAARALLKEGYGSKPMRVIGAATTTQRAPSLPAAAPQTEQAETSGNAAVVVSIASRRTPAHSDDGNTQALIDRYGHVVRYCTDRGRWYAWTGIKWEMQPQKGGLVREHAKEIARSLPVTSRAEETWQQRSLSALGITSTLTSAESDPRVTVTLADFDANPWALNTPGGIVDLRTGIMTPCAPEGLHTRVTRCAPDASADASLWLNFLDSTFAGDQELVDYMRRLIGYSATGYIGPHVLPFAYGHGGNGKGTLLESSIGVLGDYGTTSPNSFLMQQNYAAHETEIARLSGARMVLCSEVNERDRFDESKIKQLTGGDTLTARFMRADHFTFKPTHHLWLLGNHQPTVTSGGPSFWRRCRLIPFTRKPEKPIDGLQDRLIDECGPAVLAWIVAGAAEFYERGLCEPASVTEATANYEHDQDTVAKFVEEECHTANSPLVRIDSSDLTTAYMRWCDAVGEQSVTAKRFVQELVSRYGVGRERSNGRRWLTGICQLVSEDEK